MRFFGGGVGHKSTRHASDKFQDTPQPPGENACEMSTVDLNEIHEPGTDRAEVPVEEEEREEEGEEEGEEEEEDEEEAEGEEEEDVEEDDPDSFGAEDGEGDEVEVPEDEGYGAL